MSGFNEHMMRRLELMYPTIGNSEAIDYERELLSVYLTDFGGKYTGFQVYDWKANPKYKTVKGGVFGLRYFTNTSPYIEGVFDAITCLGCGVDTIAVLSNNPKHLKQQLVGQH